MANYSFEKGKHGGPVGVIFPFFREVNGLIPLDQDYRDFIPAGYLRCRGQILQADQFPALAEILGVGATCIYKKEGTVLQERSANGTGGTFQLPDLGSKYITASSNPGLYNNNTIVDPENNLTINRAGIAVTLESNGDSVEFSYDGNFSLSAFTLSFSGSWRIVSPASRTRDTTLNIGNFTGHGHLGSYTIGARVNQNNQALRSASYVYRVCCPPCYQRGSRCSGSANVGVQHVSLGFDDAGEDVAHSHNTPTPTLSVSGPTGSIPAAPATGLSASSITTTVNVRTADVFKMDDVAPKFILCEYLIKF